MIGPIYDPTATPDPDGDRPILYIPLFAAGATFYPVQPPLGGHSNPLDAARVCAQHFRAVYSSLGESVRALRALCEHNDVEFQGEVVDADLLRSAVEELDSTMRAHAPTAEYLLEEPGPDVFIRIKGERMRLDARGVLVADGKAAPESDLVAIARAERQTASLDRWAQQPGRMMVRMLEGFIEQIQHMTGSPVPTEDLEQAIEYLQGLLTGRTSTAQGDEP